MITVYKTQCMQATDTKGARFKVTCINTMRSHIVPYSFSANHAAKHAIHEAFGADTAQLEFINDASKTEKFYAVAH